MKSIKFNIVNLSMVSILQSDIHSDILERIADHELYSSDGVLNESEDNKGKIYSIDLLKRLSEDNEDNDTNEDTRIRIEELYKAVKGKGYLLIVED